MDERSGTDERALFAVRDATADLEAPGQLTDRVMERVLVEAMVVPPTAVGALERVSETTASLEPDAALTDRVMGRIDASRFEHEGLARAALATASLAPSADFAPALMTWLVPAAAPRRLFADGLMRWSRATLVAASLAAAASLTLSWYSEQTFDSDALSSADTLE